MSTERAIEFRTFTNEALVPFSKYIQSPLENDHCKKVYCENNYKLMYMIAALLSRGAVVKDYILASEKTRK